MRRKPQTEPSAVNFLRRLPFRLSTEQLAARIGCDTDAVRFIVGDKLIQPLANPPKGAPMFFATADLEELGKDVRWLQKVTKVIREKVKEKNDEQKKRQQKKGGAQ